MKSKEGEALDAIQDCIDSYYHDDISDYESLNSIQDVLNSVGWMIKPSHEVEIFFEEE